MMNTNVNSFSLRRVGWLIKRDVMEHWKAGAGFLLASCAIYLFLMVHSLLKTEDLLLLGVRDAESAWWHYIGSVTLATFALLWCLAFFYASQVMAVKAGRQEAVSFLMLPATTMEKFVVRLLHIVVTPLVAVLGGLCLAEVIRFLLMPWFDLPEIFHQPVLWDVLDELNFLASPEGVTYTNSWPMGASYSVVLAQIDVLIWLGWWHSAFLVGGCRWSRFPFWKTLAVMLPLNIVAVVGYARVTRWLWHDNWAVYHRMCDRWEFLGAITPNGLFYTGLGLGVMLIVFNWCWAYRLFRRSQIV